MNTIMPSTPPSAIPKKSIGHHAHDYVESAASAALEYLERGWSPIPVDFKSKTCHLKDWQHYSVDKKTISLDFADLCNVGVLLGASNLTDIDVDSANAAPFLHWLPKTDAKWGRSQNPNSHHLYSGARPSKSFKNSTGTIIEIRSHGCYGVFPPSIHPDGEPYTWECNGEPGTCDGLEDSVIQIATAATLLPSWKQGVRHQLSLATAGLLLKAGFPVDTVIEIVVSVAKVAGDAEINDRKLAVQSTFAHLKSSEPVSGYAQLVGLIGKQDANAIASWVNPPLHDIGERAGTAKSVKQKRNVAKALRQDLASRGVFYRTPEAAELLFFHKPERELYTLDSIEFRALCGDIYGINAKEPVWGYIEEELRTFCLRHGELTEFFRFARYHDQKLYIHAGGQRVLRLDGSKIEEVDNGDDGILFKSDTSLTSIHPDFSFSGNPVRDHLVNVANAANSEWLDLYEIFIYTLFFEFLLPTKPIVLFTGVKGSGKTSAGRALKRALLGHAANVDSGMQEKADAFWAAICHNSLVCIDNVDTLVTWLADALAVVATGGTFKRRKLYETNTEVKYMPRCFVMITSRNPQSFTRDDVVDRLLLIEVERRNDFIEESQLLAQLESKRDQIWGELLTNLNKMVNELKKTIAKPPLAHRLADWARLAIRFAPILGITDIEKKLKAMEASKVDFALDDQPLVQGLEEWISQNPQHDFISSGELFQKINSLLESKGHKWAIKTSRTFGVLLKNLRPELETRYKIADKPGPNNKKLFRFQNLPADALKHVSSETLEELSKKL